MSKEEMEKLHLELSVKAKNGLDFILAATLVWLIIAFIWTQGYSSYNKSVLTFIVGGVMLPLAFLFSKILKTEWTINSNPLQPLGIWLNVAQLFYFPFLVFALIMQPDYFVMVYVIITGAHFFPYAWYFKAIPYAIMAGVISIGALLIGLTVTPGSVYLVALFMSACLLILATWLYILYRQRSQQVQ